MHVSLVAPLSLRPFTSQEPIILSEPIHVELELQEQQRLRSRYNTKREETILGNAHEFYLNFETEVVLVHLISNDRYYVYIEPV